MLLQSIIANLATLSFAQSICSSQREFCIYSQRSSESTIQVKAITHQPDVAWCAFGFGSSMHDADVYIAYPGHVSHRSSSGHSEPKEIDQVEIDTDASGPNGGWSVEFTIPYKEEYDGQVDVIWAWGTQPIREGHVSIHDGGKGVDNTGFLMSYSGFGSRQERHARVRAASYYQEDDDYEDDDTEDYERPPPHYHHSHRHHRYYY